MSWSVVAEVIGIVGQPTIVRLMPGLRPSRTGVLAFLFLVGGRRLRRSPRRFVRSLKLDHQLNQLRPCSGAANQCDPCAHGFRDWTPWQGGAEIRSLVPIGAPKMAVGNYDCRASLDRKSTRL